jgi:hypothetical protein
MSLWPLLPMGWEHWAWGGGLCLGLLWSISIAPLRGATAFSLQTAASDMGLAEGLADSAGDSALDACGGQRYVGRESGRVRKRR